MTKQRLKENFFLAMGGYASHRKDILDFDRWHEAITTIKHNPYVKEIKSGLENKQKQKEEE